MARDEVVHYVKMFKTKKHFSLFHIFFAISYIFRYSAAFGSIWKLTVFANFHCFDT